MAEALKCKYVSYAKRKGLIALEKLKQKKLKWTNNQENVKVNAI